MDNTMILMDDATLVPASVYGSIVLIWIHTAQVQKKAPVIRRLHKPITLAINRTSNTRRSIVF